MFKTKSRNIITQSVLYAAVVFAFVLSACSYDREAGVSREDYKNLVKPKLSSKAKEPPIPQLHSVIASPTPPLKTVVDTKRVTISVTDTTPLRDVLIELARRAELDMELDPRIRGGIIFSAIDRTVREVIERICNTAGLRYELKNNVLHIEKDDPYVENYHIEALNITRVSESVISTNTDVFSAVGGSSGAGAEGNSSTSQITSSSSSDFWAEIETSIDNIISTSRVPDILVSPEAQTLQLAPVTPEALETQPPVGTAAPAVTGTAPNQDITTDEQAIAAAASIAEAETAAATAGTTAEATASGGTAGSAAGVALPSEGATALASGTSATGTAEEENDNGYYFTLNRNAGIVTVYAPSRLQKSVKEYIDKLKKSISSQVLIEAKIVEVTLEEQFRTGINWQSLSNSNFNFSSTFGRGQVFPPVGDTIPTAAVSFRTGGRADIDGLLDLIDSFGTVRTLSSPRLTVMNNQTAVLKVAENEVYFRIEIEREDLDNGTSRANFTSTINTVPIGLIMTVQPTIDNDGGQVTMAMRPTISRVSRRVSDPAVALEAASLNVSVESLIPVVEVRELDSVITIQTGEVVVMGGLMQERVQKSENGIPLAKDVPVLGHAFKDYDDQTDVTELVIFMKATIIGGRDSVAPADVDLYKKFAPDPRPIAF